MTIFFFLSTLFYSSARATCHRLAAVRTIRRPLRYAIGLRYEGRLRTVRLCDADVALFFGVGVRAPSRDRSIIRTRTRLLDTCSRDTHTSSAHPLPRTCPTLLLTILRRKAEMSGGSCSSGSEMPSSYNRCTPREQIRGRHLRFFNSVLQRLIHSCLFEAHHNSTTFDTADIYFEQVAGGVIRN
jgi:hypothetical protein